MGLIAVAADKGAPGVTTTALALAAVWPRPVLLAECDPAGGDVAWRLRAGPDGRLDPRRGLLSLAVAARRGIRPDQVWPHVQKLHGGLDVLLGTAHAEQGSGLDPLWAAVGAVLAALPQADVIADCGRLGPDGPFYDLLAHAAAVVLVTRPTLAEVLRLRDRAAVVSQATARRTGRPAQIGVLVIAGRRRLRGALGDVARAVTPEVGPVTTLGGIVFEPTSAEALRGEWGGKLDRSLFIRTVREVAGQLAGPRWLPESAAEGGSPAAAAPTPAARPVPRPGPGRPGPPWDDLPASTRAISRTGPAGGLTSPPDAGAVAGAPTSRAGW